MATQTMISTHTRTRAAQLFDRVVVGVDRSSESVEAARQAAVLVEHGGALTLLGAWTVPPPSVSGLGPAVSYESNAAFYRQPVEEAVTTAELGLPPDAAPTTKVVRGRAWDELIKEAQSTRATLLVVGSHGQGRMRGIVMGSTATEIVHKAPCSVLVARRAGGPFPRRIVVGVDGSPQSAAAYEVARRLAERFGSELWPVVAHGGGVDKEAVARIVDDHREDLQDEPVPALLAAAADADLLVVGSRGLHGFKALGSVSERVAHRAHCSTLIVRDIAGEEEL